MAVSHALCRRHSCWAAVVPCPSPSRAVKRPSIVCRGLTPSDKERLRSVLDDLSRRMDDDVSKLLAELKLATKEAASAYTEGAASTFTPPTEGAASTFTPPTEEELCKSMAKSAEERARNFDKEFQRSSLLFIPAYLAVLLSASGDSLLGKFVGFVLSQLRDNLQVVQ